MTRRLAVDVSAMDTKYCLTFCLIVVVRCAFMQVAGLQGQVAELHELAVSAQAASAALQEQLTASKAEGQRLTDLLQVRVRNSHASVLLHLTSDRMGCCWCLLGMSKIICTLCVCWAARTRAVLSYALAPSL